MTLFILFHFAKQNQQVLLIERQPIENDKDLLWGFIRSGTVFREARGREGKKDGKANEQKRDKKKK